MTTRWIVAGVAAIGLFTLPVRAAAPTLGIQGDRLTVDGTPRFLVFISYFDAMRRAAFGGPAPFDADFQFFRGTVDGLRVLVNWCRTENGSCEPADDTLFTSEGVIQDAAHWSAASMPPWDRFVAVLSAAQAHGLLVNVTFSREAMARPPTVQAYGLGIRSVIARLESEHPGRFRNLFFDVQNEWTKYPDFTPEALARLVREARQGRADAIVTGSQERQTPEAALASARAAGFQMIAFHDCRGCRDWHQRERISSERKAMSASGNMPVIYDEPTAYCAPGAATRPCRPGDSAEAAHFVDAALNAEAAGVALWNFHTREAFQLRAAPYVAQASAAQKAILSTIRERLPK
jgi:hypothetical protein